MKLRGLVIAALVLHAISAPINAAERGVPIAIGERFTMESKVLGETRTYLVHKPERYDQTNDAYPLLILIFGDDNIQHVAASADFLAGSDRIPQMLVVGINVSNASRDLTAPIADPKFAAENPTAGGAAKFLNFVSDELIPRIESNYRTRPYRILVGHSYGGMFAVYTLLNKPEIFNAYISVSPTLFWDNQALVKAAEPFLAAHRDLRSDFFMTIGDEDTDAVGSAIKLSAAFEESMPWQEKGKPRELRWQFHHYKGETHFSGRQRSVYDGLKAVFDGWYVHDPFALYEIGGVAAFERHYQNISTRVGYAVPTPLRLFSLTAQTLVRRNRVDEAEVVMTKAVEVYPNNSSARSGLARIYSRKKEDGRAIEQLTAALKLYPGSDSIRSMLTNYKVDIDKIVPDVALPPKTLASLVGSYRSDDTSVAIELEGKKLFAASTAGRTELRAISDTEFYYVNAEVRVTFQKDRRGRVTSMRVQRLNGAYVLNRVK